MKFARIRRVAVLSGVVALLASGCTWTGLNSVPLPFTKGGGSDRVEVTIHLENAANLVPNSEVKYDEVTVGSVRKIELDDWTAVLTVGLEGDAQIPADVTAAVAQKSLLGAEYLALADPEVPDGRRESGFLETDDVIGLERTSRYPETEEVLAAGSMLLNGGGLPQIRTIAHELNEALGGREGDIKSFMKTTENFTRRLDGQRDDIVATLRQLDRLSRIVVRDQDKIEHALAELPEGFRLLSEERKQLVKTLQAVDGFGKVADRVIGSTKADLERNLEYLRPITKELAANGKLIARGADLIGYPFLVRPANNIIYGDYMNLIGEVSISTGDLTQHWLGGTPLDGLFNGLIGSPLGPVGDATDSLDGLVGGLLGGGDAGGLLGGGDGLLGGGGLLGQKDSQNDSKSTSKDESSGDGGLLSGLLGGGQ